MRRSGRRTSIPTSGIGGGRDRSRLFISIQMKVQFIRNYTAEPLGEALANLLAKCPTGFEATFGAYGNVLPELFDIASSKVAPNVLVLTLHLDFFGAGIHSSLWNFAEAEAELNQILRTVEKLPATVYTFISNFVPPTRAELPILGLETYSGRDNTAQEFNLVIREFVKLNAHKCGLLDFQKIAARLGELATFDLRFGLMKKVPFKPAFFEAAASEIQRVLSARSSSPKKVIVLDCDNTLWGGVVGEVGTDGIQLDPYEYPGIAFYRFQASIFRLLERGVLVCLCSKNDEPAVWEVLDRHPHCLIKRKHLAAVRINWQDKAANLLELAQELNISLDSMVFVDDSPVECELIRTSLPQVTVVQVPAKIYRHSETLLDLTVFDRTSVSREDAERLTYYQAERARKDVQTPSLDHATFLRELAMRAVVRELKEPDLPRAAQLCQRTNQFNLTTKRHTEQDLAAMSNRADVKIYLLEAADKFGPIGTSGMVILVRTGGQIEIETFLLSCRIIGRKFDRALLFRALQLATREWPETVISGLHIPTAKNTLVKNIFAEYGFGPALEGDQTRFRADTSLVDSRLPEEILIVEKL